MLAEASHRAGSLLRRVLPLFVLLAVTLGAGACSGDDDDDPSGPGGSIIGTWTAEDGTSVLYLEITETHIRTFLGSGGPCFVTQTFEILDQDGAVYTIEAEGNGIQFETEIRRSGDNLVIDDEETWEPSDVDVDELDICGPVELPACSALTELGFETGAESGDLDAGDPVDAFGAFYELHSIVIDGTMPDAVAVEMNSTDFDAYLVVFDDAGNAVAENDDRDLGTTDARVDLSLAAGCYIVMATSFAAGETGGYQISFD